MTNDNDLPAAPPPLAAWWGHTGLLYVRLSVLGAVASSAAAMLIWNRTVRQEMPTVSEYVMAHVQGTNFYGAAVGVAQWLVLRSLVRRALRAASGRDTALWIVATIAGQAMGRALSGVNIASSGS